MKILWIGGWAIPSSILNNLVISTFPSHDHLCIHPHEKFSEIIYTYKPDTIVGYSLGATLLLNTPNPQNQYLIAPFLNIKEATQIHNTQLMFLLKWLKNDPLNAINDFYQRAQLPFPKLTNLPYLLPDLIWGIETLISTQNTLIHPNKKILLGDKDPLINPKFFAQYTPKPTILLNTNHGLHAYLNYLPF